MAGAEWYYGKENKQHGPVSAAELKRLAQQGQLRPSDLVWREGMDEWTPASKVRGLFEDAAPAPPAGAPAAPPPPPKPASPGVTPPRPAADDLFAQAAGALAPAARRRSPHPLDLVLQYVRGRFNERFIEATEKLFTLGGHYGLYAAMVLVLGFGLIGGVKLNDLNSVLMALAFAAALAVLQYAARRFLQALDELNRSTSGKLGSTTVPDCFALLSMIFGVVALLGLAVMAVQVGGFVLLLPGIVIFILCQYLAVLAVNHGALNVAIDADSPAGEEALGICSFAIKIWLRLVPVACGVGVACGVIVLLVACGLLFLTPGAGAIESAAAAAEAPPGFGEFAMDMDSDDEASALMAALAAGPAFAAATAGTWLVTVSAALPLVAYLLFIFAHLWIDVVRAVLALRNQPTAPAETRREE